MTKLLDAALAQVRELTEAEQDAAADALFVHLAGNPEGVQLTDAQVREVERIRRNLQDGRTTLVSDDEMAAFWRSVGA
jgi:hypothetical protein